MNGEGYPAQRNHGLSRFYSLRVFGRRMFLKALRWWTKTFWMKLGGIEYIRIVNNTILYHLNLSTTCIISTTVTCFFEGSVSQRKAGFDVLQTNPGLQNFYAAFHPVFMGGAYRVTTSARMTHVTTRWVLSCGRVKGSHPWWMKEVLETRSTSPQTYLLNCLSFENLRHG